MSSVTGRLKEFINYGLGITIATAFALLSRDDLIASFKSEPIAGGLAIALLATTIVRFFLYIAAVRTEVDFMEWGLDTEKVIALRGPVFPVVIGLSVTFAALIATVTNILWHSIIAVIFALLDMFGPIVINRNIGAVLIERKFRHEDIGGPAYILYRYYFGRPIIMRVAIMLVSAVAACTLAVVWRFTGHALLQYGSYLLIISTIVIGEFVMHRWREQRNREIDSYDEAAGVV